MNRVRRDVEEKKGDMDKWTMIQWKWKVKDLKKMFNEKDVTYIKIKQFVQLTINIF